MTGRILHECLVPYIVNTGLYVVVRLETIAIDHALITVLVERWRQETHTFHLPVGETTVTLQDVAVLLGLRIDGRLIISPIIPDVRAMCQELLGVTPDERTLDGTGLRLRWLRDTFGAGPPPQATEDVVGNFARAYILALIGVMLFADKSRNQVRLFLLPLLRDLEEAGSLSRGSAVLACLYHELCRATSPDNSGIAGPLIILQGLHFLLNIQGRTIIDSNFCRHGHGSASTLIVWRD